MWTVSNILITGPLLPQHISLSIFVCIAIYLFPNPFIYLSEYVYLSISSARSSTSQTPTSATSTEWCATGTVRWTITATAGMSIRWATWCGWLLLLVWHPCFDLITPKVLFLNCLYCCDIIFLFYLQRGQGKSYLLILPEVRELASSPKQPYQLKMVRSNNLGKTDLKLCNTEYFRGM